MPVTVSRTPPTVAPVEKIVLADKVQDTLTFESPSWGVRDRLQARVWVVAGREAFVHVTRADARSLAAALYEWADGVDPS